MKSTLMAAAVSLVFTVLPGRGAAQQSRASLIDQARAEFSDSAAAQLLLSAQDPALGPRDSLWAVAGYEMAATQLRQRQRELALVWLRWVVRHASQWPIDRAWFPPSVVDAFDDAFETVQEDQDPDDEALRTTWTWPTRFDRTASGTVEVAGTGSAASPVIQVVGREDPGTSRVTLQAGTYELEVNADGHEPRRVRREVLPGVTTSLTVELPPLLPEQSQATVAAKLVRIRYMRGAEQVCSNGFLASADGLVLTSHGAIPDGTSVDVLGPDGVELSRNVSIAASDPERSLAVLKLPQAQTEAIPTAANVADGQYAWSVHFADCSSLTSARTRLTAWPSPPGAPVPLSAALPAGAVGSPLVNREGMLLGLIGSTGSVTPAALTQDVLERARRATVVAQVRPRGGFPWKWAGAGAAAAGLAVVLLGGGGGGGNDAPPPTTGGITITFAN
jgi:hypothetical protein